MNLYLCLLLQLQLLVICVSAVTIGGGTQIPSNGNVLDTFVAWISGDDACSQRTVFGGTSPCGSTFTLNGAQYLFVGCNGGSPAEVHDGNGSTLGSCSTRVDTEKLDCSNSPYPVYWNYECIVGSAAASTTSASTQASPTTTEMETSAATTAPKSQSNTPSSQSSLLSISNTSETNPRGTVTAISSKPTTLSTSTTAGTTPSSTATAAANPSNNSSSGMTLEARIELGIGISFGVVMFVLALLMFKKPRQLARRFLRYIGCMRGP